jgi:peptide/nickel transport system substrate-binding protein
MQNSISFGCYPLARWFAALALLLSAGLVGSWLSSDLAAQDKTKPSKKEEEEDPAAKPKRPVPVVGDEEKEEKGTKPAAKSADRPATDLEREAELAKNPVVQQLFRSLAKPHDLLTTPTGRSFRIEPIPEYIGPEPSFKGSLSLRVMNDQGKLRPPGQYKRNDVTGIDAYEEIAIEKVDEFLKSALDQEPEGSPKFLSRREMLREAEKVLVSVVRFHESARESGRREGDAWKKVAQKLRGKLRDVQLGQLRSLTDAKDWETAFELAMRLRDNYRKDEEVQKGVADLLAQHALHALDSKNYPETRKRLRLLEETFRSSSLTEKVREGLRARAAQIMAEAQKLEKEGDKQEAIRLLQTAESIYPQLPGLYDYSLRLNQQYPILYVGVRYLPEYMSPATAFTDSEKQAVELQFESLVKLAPGRTLGQRYEVGLAEELPQLVPLGRRFQLIRNAYWSDSHKVTGVDVRNTVELLCKYPGRIPEWADLMEQGQGARTEGDQFHVTLTLRQGYVDPLSMMDFKILPEWLKSADDQGFGKNPIGSGPYKYDPEKSKPGEEMVFIANPYYGTRPGKGGLPFIREIHFVVSQNPAVDFETGRLHLLLDLSMRQFRNVTLPKAQTQTVSNRRIYFLAVNHRKSPLQSKDLRQAIAHAINREEILNEKFRAGVASYHKVLNGPYPPSSWAYLNKLPPDPHDDNLARAKAQKVKTEKGTLPRLRLFYPDRDLDVAEACDKIRQQLEQLGIMLELKAVSPRELRRLVEESHDYDLAYYHWDYPNEAYWLWPLFDPTAAGPGGRNFLGYQNDAELTNLFRKAMERREFKAIQEITHDIHALLYEEMPLIPLWQLDTHYAVRSGLTLPPPGTIDPLLMFTDIEKWKLEKR